MSSAAHAGHAIIAGIPHPYVCDTARALVCDADVLGIILFRRNLQSPAQAHALIRDLRALRREPLLMCVDQEGGRVQRLRAPLTDFPSMRALAHFNDPTLIEEATYQLGREILAVGFDLTFAPVVDVDTNPANPVIGDRAFSPSPEETAKFAAAAVRGLTRAGLLSCAKHFPGHGDTAQDSHLELPTLPHDLARLRRIEWPPFSAAAAAGVSSVMTAHIRFLEIDPLSPATLSRAALAFLREELGFTQGPIISDDLEMKAIQAHYPVDEAAVRAIDAGCDALLICQSADEVTRSIRALERRAAADANFAARLSEAVMRNQALRSQARGAQAGSLYVPAPGPSAALHTQLTAASRLTLTQPDPTEKAT